MSAAPRVVIGVPTYNNVKHVESSLRSLMAQTVADIRIVVCDEGSTDGSLEILRRLAAEDARVDLHVNPARLGYIGNANRALALAARDFPTTPFYAWASDHDLWEPQWLARMLEALEARPEAVAAWSWAYRLDDDGAVVEEDAPSLGTGGSDRPLDRLRFAAYGLHAGTSVYALYRRRPLERLGGFRYVIDPDRMLMTELALAGPFVQVPEFLWSRRYVGLAKRARQRRSFFPGGAPAYAYAPRSAQHCWVVFRDMTWRGLLRPEVSRLLGVAAVAAYLLQRRRRIGELVARWWRPLPRTFGYRVIKPIRMAAFRLGKRLRGAVAAALGKGR